jgi:hypothetical protein
MRQAYTVEQRWWDQHDIVEVAEEFVEEFSEEDELIYLDIEQREVYHHTKIS